MTTATPLLFLLIEGFPSLPQIQPVSRLDTLHLALSLFALVFLVLYIFEKLKNSKLADSLMDLNQAAVEAMNTLTPMVSGIRQDNKEAFQKFATSVAEMGRTLREFVGEKVDTVMKMGRERRL